MASDLDMAQLRVFVTCARSGSISRAATALGHSQPALSQQLRRLERAVGQVLLHRAATGVTLTKAGETLLPYGFSADGKIVWAHVSGPLAHEAPDGGRGEEWLVINAADGTLLARAETGTAAAGSVHVPHPDPGQMGLTIGEGQDGSPLRWGRWDGHALAVDSFGDEDRVLLAVCPSGDRLLTVTHDQDTLAVHRVTDGSAVAELGADAVPQHPAIEEGAEDDEAQTFFDYEGGFLDESTLVVGTVESDEEFGTGRHWLVDSARMRLIDRLTYPFEVSGLPKALGDGTWYTVSDLDNALHVWTL